MYEPVAIVGTACRLPGSSNCPSKLWNLLSNPRDVLKEFPSERLKTANIYNKNGDMDGRTNVQHKSFLLDEDISHFDAAFFRINPKEAADMDPQQRILLETVFEVFEAAGWPLSRVNGSSTSVHVGCMTQDYSLIQARDPDTTGGHVATGASRSILSNRISYAFNLRGASMTLDTACSSSLVALHLAVQGLQRGEASQAVVAGTNLLIDPFWYIIESSMHLLSEDSRCRMWDRDAGGYARGEGCAAVVLKTLSQAVRDGDHIECVIRGSNVNSDGATSGITMPSPEAQSKLIHKTYLDAGLDPTAATDRCQYFECHGTGTQAGDPIEARAIRDTFFPDIERKEGNDDGRLFCGSIKTIIGHLEGCAGLAGVIKASLAIQNKAIPPNMHFNHLSSKVEPFYKNLEVPTSLIPWPETYGGPRRASVNSFGFGGTNAHAILESYDPSSPTNVSSLDSSISDIKDDSVYEMARRRLVGPFLFSARTRTSLVDWLKRLLTYLRDNKTVDLEALSGSLQSKRTVFPHRSVISAASDMEDLIQKVEDQINALGTSLDGGSPAHKSVRILGVFTGQGAQAARMGSALLEHCKTFNASILACEEALKSIPEPPQWSLGEELSADSANSRISEAKFSQPLCTAVQIGLVDLAKACGIRFSAVVGHSSGEIGAAYAAGLLTKRDAMGISYYRGHVAHLAKGNGDAEANGGMMAAAMSLDAATALSSETRFRGRISVAASNSPSSVTLSGDKDAVIEMKAHLDSINVQARALQVDVAYHSHHMLACADAYLGHLKELNVQIQTPPKALGDTCRWYSSVRAGTDILERVVDSGLEAQYWLDNMVQPVLFSEAIKLAVNDDKEITTLLEIGPHPALKGPVTQTLKQAIPSDRTNPQYASCLSRGRDSVETFSEILAMIWSADPSSVDFGGWRSALGLAINPQPLKDLPPYAWDHTQTHWRESRVNRNYRLGKQPPVDLLGRLWNDTGYENTWRHMFRIKEMLWVKGHVFQGQVLFPATGYISLAVDAAKAFVVGRPIQSIQVEDLEIPTALVVSEERDVEVLFTIRSHVLPGNLEDESVVEAEFTCYSYPDGQVADKTCAGRLLIHLGDPELRGFAATSISDVDLTPFNVDRFYKAASDIGFGYDGPFRAMTSLNRCWGHAKAIASWKEAALSDINCAIHPAILDIALQAGLATFVSTAEGSMPCAYLPIGIKRALIYPNLDFRNHNESTEVEIEAYMTSPEVGKRTEIDINVQRATPADSSDDIGGIQIQFEGVTFQALSEPQPSQDRNIFAKTVWAVDPAYGLTKPPSAPSKHEDHIVQLVLQASHKFPRTKILEINIGTGKAVCAPVLSAIGDAYHHYSFAGASDGIINGLQQELGADIEDINVSFHLVDAEFSATLKQYESASYDVLIAVDAFGADRDLSGQLRDLRRLIRPGGFLIAVAESTLTMTTGEWDRVLEQQGFSGIDESSMINEEQSDGTMKEIIIYFSQATDDRLDLLRDPMVSIELIAPTTVILIGGETSLVSKLIRQSQKVLRSWATSIQTYSRIDQVDNSAIPPGASFISFQDLDTPTFSSSPSTTQLASLKKLVATCRNVLWLTSGRLGGNPYANIMLGIGRSLRIEFPETTIHYLDFGQDEPFDFHVIISQFLRLALLSSSPGLTDNMLWAEEQEVVIKDSQMLIPRVVPDHSSNVMYNARRRRLTKLIGVEEPVEIVKDGVDASQTVISYHTHALHNQTNHLPLQVKLSVGLVEEGVDQTPLFLCYGTVESPQGSRKPTLSLSKTNSSVCHVREGFHFDCLGTLHKDIDAAGLASIASLTVASCIVSQLPSDGTTLICGAYGKLAHSIRLLAADANRKIQFVEMRTRAKQQQMSSDEDRDGWILVHPSSTSRSFRQLIPRDTVSLYGLSRKYTEGFLSWLSSDCSVRVFNGRALTLNSIQDAIKAYNLYHGILRSASKPEMFGIQQVADGPVGGSVLSAVIDWERATPINATLRGLIPSTLLSPDKTYLLVGMASELGQSLTYFMVRAGAHHIVLSSRNPSKAGQKWMEHLKTSAGIDIRVVKMDVTIRSEVRETVEMLRRAMPEIGGVANAALVLEPGIFANLSAESIAKQMKPKIDGTMNLDDEFKTTDLDFFLTFGSLATVCGNAGQSIYHAGNAFMMSLVQNRRQRGLAASILNFGMLVDVGYVARSDRSTADSSVEDWLRTEFTTVLSESDFHHCILQGIVTGRLSSTGCGEVIMGLEMFYDQGQASKPRWVDSARFSHMVRVSKATGDAKIESGSASSVQQWQQSLESASTAEEAVLPITQLLSKKVESMIHASLDSIQPDEPMSHLGIDSINAIEIRQWFRETVNADVSMLKIYGRDSLASIIRLAAEQFISKKPQDVHKDVSEPVKDTESAAVAEASANPTTDDPPPSTVPLKNDSDTTSSTKGEAMPTPSQSSTGESVHIAEPQTSFTRSERLSFAQSGFFYLSSLSDDPTSFNLTVKFSLKGRLDTARFGRAFDQVMHHHDALRTCFLATDGASVMQHLAAENSNIRLSLVHITDETAKSQEDRAFSEIVNHQYSLSTGDSLRATLITNDAQTHTLILGYHNIVIDAISIGLILADVNRAIRFQPLQAVRAGSYLDFTRQQIEDIQMGRLDDGINYWKRLLDPIPESIPLLPMAKVDSRNMSQSYGYHLVEEELSSELVQRAKQLSRAHGVPLMQFYLAVLRVLLCRLLGIDDICIGVMYHGRNTTSAFENTVGHLANILPARFKGHADQSFPEVLENTFTTFVECVENADVPIGLILEKIESGRAVGGGMPLFQVAYDYRVGQDISRSIGGCTVDLVETNYTTIYDLTVDIVDSSSSDGHAIALRCSADFYSLETTHFMAETFVHLTEFLVANSSAVIRDVSPFSDSQLQQAAMVASGPRVEYSWPQTLPERFEQIAAKFPSCIAVRDSDRAFTYDELRQLIGIYAGELLDGNTKAGSRIAVLCEPGIDLYASMLAIFYIGAVFIPLDMSVPAARHRDMIKACQPHLLVYHSSTAISAIELGAECTSLNIAERARASSEKRHSLPKLDALDSTADSYILFTSGSTGVPKGIRLHQRGMMHYAAYTSEKYGLEFVKVLQQTSIGFDLSLAQIYNAFCNGGTLVVASREARGDPDMLSRLMHDEKIEYTFATPSEYTSLLNYAPVGVLQKCLSWRFCHTGGESLPQRLIDSMRDLKLPGLMLSNLYGPAEAFVVTSMDIPVHTRADGGNAGGEAKLKSIGSAIPNVSVHIVNEGDGSLLPVGMPGEICVSGIGVANGFLDPSLPGCHDKFVKNPFASAEHLKQGLDKMYKSGDRGILQVDGSVTFLGRCVRGKNDAMIKLRGLRVDLNEVATAVLSTEPHDIADAVVTVRGDDSQQQFLVCHVVPKTGQSLSLDRLATLPTKLTTLPQYMIPSVFAPLDRLPITLNGKLNTKLLETMPLPSFTLSQAIAEETAPDSDTADADAEARLRSLWVDVIGKVAEAANIERNSSFFSVGGNSMLLVQLQYLVDRDMNVRVHLRLLREHSTLRAMARLIKKNLTEQRFG